MLARFYSPWVGRFLGVDPVLGEPELPQSWNRNAYVRGNPVRNTDPTGEVTGSEIADYVEPVVQGTAEDLIRACVRAMDVQCLLGVTATGLLAYGAVDTLRMGEAAGTALGSGAGGGQVVLAVGEDGLRVLGFVGTVGGAARAGLVGLGRFFSGAGAAIPRSGPIPASVGASSRALYVARKVKLNPNSPISRQVLNSLDDDVLDFIGNYRQGRIKEVFPGEFLQPGVTVEDALLNGGPTVRKLLTNKRFLK